MVSHHNKVKSETSTALLDDQMDCVMVRVSEFRNREEILRRHHVPPEKHENDRKPRSYDEISKCTSPCLPFGM